MKKLLNTLYITAPNRYLSLDGENVVVLEEEKEIGRLPLHNLEAIVTCGYTGASPKLMEACALRNVALSFMTQYGNFLARVSGKVKGNVTLRKEQYRISDDETRCTAIAQNMIIGKLYNSKWVVERVIRDHALRVDVEKLKKCSEYLTNSIEAVKITKNTEQLRGVEGEAASIYFGIYNEMILQQKEKFVFRTRTRRPPLDNVNAMLSFGYTLLANQCASALETVGLDPYVGFLHKDRPGRTSLALDLMEELRAVMVDRFVLTLINKKIVNSKGFMEKENGAIIMEDDTRKTFLTAWQEKKQDMIKHPFLEEKVEWGMVPYVQALLLARYIRGDLDEYPTFLWK